MLLTADAEAESTPIDPGPVDVLKVAHHGSEDAGLGELLERTRPRLAVISVGEDNPYGHPTAATLGELAAHGSPPCAPIATARSSSRSAAAGSRSTARVERDLIWTNGRRNFRISPRLPSWSAVRGSMALEVISRALAASPSRRFSLRNVAGGGVAGAHPQLDHRPLRRRRLRSASRWLGSRQTRVGPSSSPSRFPGLPPSGSARPRPVGEATSRVVNAGAPRGGVSVDPGETPRGPIARHAQTASQRPARRGRARHSSPPSPRLPARAGSAARARRPRARRPPASRRLPPQARRRKRDPEPAPNSPPVESPAPVDSPSERRQSERPRQGSIGKTGKSQRP